MITTRKKWLKVISSKIQRSKNSASVFLECARKSREAAVLCTDHRYDQDINELTIIDTTTASMMTAAMHSTPFNLLNPERFTHRDPAQPNTVHSGIITTTGVEIIGNDPSAGSPTETLLRLLLPLNDQIWKTFRQSATAVTSFGSANQNVSLNHSIGSSDGRCVQRAGT